MCLTLLTILLLLSIQATKFCTLGILLTVIDLFKPNCKQAITCFDVLGPFLVPCKL
uniref:Uncharacterized protein n=1 Tax=Rhizophora mucronata TaxID=61149 RepID=A0A2P2QVL5_RHIMU